MVLGSLGSLRRVLLVTMLIAVETPVIRTGKRSAWLRNTFRAGLLISHLADHNVKASGPRWFISSK